MIDVILYFRSKAEHINTLDEFHSSKKSEVHNLQDKISEKDRTILDLQAQISNLSSTLSSKTSSAEDETKMLSAKIDKLSNESEDLRGKKRELESNVRKLENELETTSQSNSELSIRIIEKEQQYKEVRTQVESMRVTYEKHQKGKKFMKSGPGFRFSLNFQHYFKFKFVTVFVRFALRKKTFGCHYINCTNSQLRNMEEKSWSNGSNR